jgi:hypothetical protein
VLVNGASVASLAFTRPAGSADNGDGDEEEEEKERNYTLDIRTEEERTDLTTDGEDSIWLYALVRCDDPEVDTLALTQALSFSTSGPDGSWLKLEQEQMQGERKAVLVRAEPPSAEADLTEGKATVLVSGTVEDHQVNGPVDFSLDEEWDLEVLDLDQDGGGGAE